MASKGHGDTGLSLQVPNATDTQDSSMDAGSGERNQGPCGRSDSFFCYLRGDGNGFTAQAYNWADFRQETGM